MSKTISFSVLCLFIGSLILPNLGKAQETQAIKEAVSSLKLRNIGPALMGGRIADIAISQDDPSTWYLAVGSGGVWKTINSGITWDPIFDNEKSYSIGTVTIDPSNSQTIWVGTGENVSGRHVAWGDGVYKSLDGGKTWKQMGLPKSEHIGKILVDPRNSDVVFVAAEGPLWSAGGERGVFKSMNGGDSWKQVLEIDENTGVTDIEFDPSNPDNIYAAAYQRRRQTWSLMGGGPNSGIYKSTNSGEAWRKINTGLPSGDVGKIGLAVTAADPSLVYATIEANDKEKGFYKSENKGESYQKMNSYISGGTGPHYYQEIEVSQTDPNLIYQMDVFLHVSRDGGKTFNYLGNGREKHSDNHALWINPHNGKHLIAGTDGGLYESFDQGSKWRHFPNLPISQFYKLGLDNAEPYYNIVGGAQDLGTLIGPSRTMNTEGIRNQDWYVPLGADGYESVFDPEDPNTVYMEIQQGLLHRLDRRNEEVVNIQPQPGPNDPPERWNWDSPIVVSPHNHERLYFGSQRLWKSDNRGNSWEAISGDLTTNTNRYELEIADRVWSVDALYDNGAMSKYATLTSISESPKVEGLLYTGSDDGLINISEDDGSTWRKSGRLPGVVERSFINDVEASSHDGNMVFAVADAHKFGDYSPYLFVSKDRGKSWSSIAGDLPQGTIVWVIKQDHVDENLLFIGTEYGVYFSINQGKNWIMLNGGVPPIAIRDIELHTRDHDLVGATFGRGFYVLDDYSPLRDLGSAIKAKANTLFEVRDTWRYNPSVPMQAKGMPGQGSTAFKSENPPFGAVFTYFIDALPLTGNEIRIKKEKALKKDNASVPFPGWEALETEEKENRAQVLLLVKYEVGDPIRWIKGSASKGLHRTAWDLRLPAPDPINLTQPAFKPPWVGDAEGPIVAPGNYSVELYVVFEGKLTKQGEAQSFKIKEVPNIDARIDQSEVAAFKKKTSDLQRELSSASRKLGEVSERLRYIKAALLQTPTANENHFANYEQLETQLMALRKRLNGNRTKQQLNESTSPSIASRVGNVAFGHWNTRQMQTETQVQNINIAEQDFSVFKSDLKAFLAQIEKYEEALEEAGAPWTKGRKF